MPQKRRRPDNASNHQLLAQAHQQLAQPQLSAPAPISLPKPEQPCAKLPATSSSAQRKSFSRARFAEERTAQVQAFADEWVRITELELSGSICAAHAQELQKLWQSRVSQLTAYQQKRCHARVDKSLEDWVHDPDLPRRLDTPWTEAFSALHYVRTSGWTQTTAAQLQTMMSATFATPMVCMCAHGIQYTSAGTCTALWHTLTQLKCRQSVSLLSMRTCTALNATCMSRSLLALPEGWMSVCRAHRYLKPQHQQMRTHQLAIVLRQ